MSQPRCSVCRETVSEPYYYLGGRPVCARCYRPRSAEPGTARIIDLAYYRTHRVVREMPLGRDSRPL